MMKKTLWQKVSAFFRKWMSACTLENKDVPDGATAVGVPCRILGGGEEK